MSDQKKYDVKLGAESWQEQMGCGFVILCIGIAVALVIVASAWARTQ